MMKKEKYKKLFLESLENTAQLTEADIKNHITVPRNFVIELHDPIISVE